MMRASYPIAGLVGSPGAMIAQNARGGTFAS